MPQLELHDFVPQLIWLAISFIALYVIMARVALPRISTVIEERRDRIASDLDQAQRFKQETDEARAAYEEALAEARGRALTTLRETREKLAAEVDAEKIRSAVEIAGKIADAEKTIAEEKSRVLSRLGDVATEAAETIVQKLIGAKLTKAEVKQAVSKVQAG